MVFKNLQKIKTEWNRADVGLDSGYIFNIGGLYSGSAVQCDVIEQSLVWNSVEVSNDFVGGRSLCCAVVRSG